MQTFDLFRPLLLGVQDDFRNRIIAQIIACLSVADGAGEMQLPAETVIHVAWDRLQTHHTGLGDVRNQMEGQAETVGAELFDLNLGLEALKRDDARPGGDGGALGVIDGNGELIAGIAEAGEVVAVGDGQRRGHGGLYGGQRPKIGRARESVSQACGKMGAHADSIRGERARAVITLGAAPQILC